MLIKDGRVVSNFINQALHDRPFTLYRIVKKTRSFCYYSDLIEGIVRLLRSKVHDPINVGNPDEFTILQFARTVVKMSGTRSKIIFKPLPTDDPKQRRPDITLARKYLKWKPKVKLQKGLQETINWFKVN